MEVEFVTAVFVTKMHQISPLEWLHIALLLVTIAPPLGYHLEHVDEFLNGARDSAVANAGKVRAYLAQLEVKRECVGICSGGKRHKTKQKKQFRYSKHGQSQSLLHPTRE